ncbi:uncharacterized protein M6B38_341615 [Iris pallida]|uniref:Androgen receptor n=1 Tax=Iris pallida TaxID=29817 RepID=A0AAX6GXG1_IRIPA|nr:uncharacterized protein M6B38_341615 [Iris pallida]
MTKTHPQASGSSSLPERSDQAEEEVHETAPSDSTIPETQAVAQGGLPPPPQRVTAVLPEILPPLPPIPTDTHHMFLLLQQMMETQQAQAEASQRQSEASHPTDGDAEAEYGELASACLGSSRESGTGYGTGPYWPAAEPAAVQAGDSVRL